MSKSILAIVFLTIILVCLPATAQSPYVHGVHFWREGAHIDVFGGKSGWILVFEDISSYSNINYDKYKDALKEGHTIIVRLNYNGGDDPPPVAETDIFAGRCAYYAEKLRDYSTIFVYANENNVDAQYNNAYMAARYAIHAANPHAYWVPGAPNNAAAVISYAGDFCDGLATHNEGSWSSGLSALESNSASGKMKPLYITEMIASGPHRSDVARNTFRAIRDWNRTADHLVEAAMKFVFFEYYHETASLLFEPMTNAEFEDSALYYECTNSFANPYIQISNVNVNCTGETTAVITWTTDVACTTQIEYWRVGEQRQYLSSYQSTNKTSHSVTLTNLEPGATYEYVLKNHRAPHPLTLSKVMTFEQIGPNSGTITGSVKGTNGVRIDMARVTRSPGNYYVFANSEGNFTMKGVPAGNYTLRASEAGIETGVANVTVTAGGTVVVHFTCRTKSNMLTNGGFENGSQYAWTSYGNGFQTINGTWSTGPTPPHSGGYFIGRSGTTAGNAGGVYQRIAVTNGQNYNVRVFSRVERENCPWGETYNRLGVDRFGGTDPASSAVIWTSNDYPYVEDYGEWRLLTLSFTAGGSYATIFLDYKQTATSGNKINCFDDAGIFAVDSALPAYSDINTLKNQPDGASVYIGARIATSGFEDFTDRFYIEDPDRTSGIMVYTGSNPWMVAEGQMIGVSGVLTTIGGERAITNANVSVSAGWTLDPLTMVNREIGGQNHNYNPSTGAGQMGVVGGIGVNNIGLLISTSGRVKSAGSGYVIVDDGSGVDLRVDTSRVSSPPTTGQYAVFTGISGIWQSGGNSYRMLRCRRASDVLVRQ